MFVRMPPTMGETKSSGGQSWWRDRWHSGDLAPVVSLGVLIAIFTALVGPREFLSVGTASLVMEHGAVLAIVSVGMTFVLLAAEIDLAVGKVALLSTCVCGVLFEQPFAAGPKGAAEATLLSLLVVLAVPFVVALVAGWLSGFLTVTSTLPSFIITLAMMFVSDGMARYLTKSEKFNVPAVLKTIGNDGLFFLPSKLHVPYSAMLAAVVLLVGHIVLQHTRFGRYVYMTGGNREAARLAGVRTSRIVISCLVICSLTAALGGLVNAGRLESVSLDQNTELLLEAVACVVLGGTSLFGGEGGMLRTLIGVLTFTVLKVGLNSVQIPGITHFDLLRPFVMGIVLLIALVINGRIARRRG